MTQELRESSNRHHTHIVRKPWGYEYLAYSTPEVALWVLHIDQHQSTSLHCHPNKQTGFVLLAGEAELSFLADSKRLVAPSKQMIRRGLFHQTTAISSGGAVVLELETPNNKSDLVRLRDNFGREDLGYEGENEEIPKNDGCLWLDERLAQPNHTFEYEGKSIELMKFAPGEGLEGLDDDRIMVFLRGGLRKRIGNRWVGITVPGDIGLIGVIKQVEVAGSSLSPETLSLVI